MGEEKTIPYHYRKKWLLRSILAVIIILAGIYLAPKYLYFRSHVSTDDAHIEGTIVPVSAEIKGKVIKVFVNDNQPIKAGEPLLKIYSGDYLYLFREKERNLSALKAQGDAIEASIEEKKKALARTEAVLKATRAENILASKELKRTKRLLKENVVSQSKYDHVESQWMVAQANRDASRAAVAESRAAIQPLKDSSTAQNFRIKEAEAALGLAKINLSRTLVVAPISGRIAMKNVERGKYVQPGQPLLAIVDTGDVWIVANFKETQINNMRAGQPVDIKVDAYPGVILKGHVGSFQPGTGSVFSLLPPENATGNFIKVVQRVPVKIIIDSGSNPARVLWPGLSVTTYVDTAVRKGIKLKDIKPDESNRDK